MVQNTTSYNLRNSSDLRNIQARTKIFYNSFLPSTIRAWNELPEETKTVPSVASFKYRLNRKFFIINLHERMLPTSAGVEPATSWSPVGRRIQLSHRGRLTVGSSKEVPSSMRKNVRIHIILNMRNVSSGPLLSIEKFCSIQ